MSVERRWLGDFAGGDQWSLVIEHDCFGDGEPFVVTLWAECEEGGKTDQTLVCATPQEAREMADALRVYADLAEQAEARRSPSPETPPDPAAEPPPNPGRARLAVPKGRTA